MRSAVLPALALLLAGPAAFGHGGVVEENDLCVIRIDYLKAHFKVYQPRRSGHREYCEDLPAAAESVFVMDYLHDGLGEVPIDFRIIRDVTGKGRFARWQDVAAIDNLDAVTVFHRPAAVAPDVLAIVHTFDRGGDYIGVVTTTVGDKVRRAVFPFEVGFTGLGIWPWIIAVVLAVQLQYLAMSGRLSRWWRARHGTAMIALLACAVAGDARADSWTSAQGHYSVEVESELDPIPINRMHSWTLTLTGRDGAGVPGADITIRGGMPAHDHGLPTRPRVTADLGDGRYRVDGLRFHMPGRWEVVLTVDAGPGRDEVVIVLEL